jgi:hypothetical protein
MSLVKAMWYMAWPKPGTSGAGHCLRTTGTLFMLGAAQDNIVCKCNPLRYAR